MTLPNLLFTALFMAALTTAIMILWRCWTALIPAYRALRAELDGVPETLPVRTRLTLPPIRKRSFGPFPAIATQRSLATKPMRAAVRQNQVVHFA
ncbi:hypothetical protein GCM10011614_07450 [Novosphingobium colocasiae]|uniref:Uncharacterized protein n=2 Tax=Novosphingobium colocasiae TaxID=1256513 RepID=A0A918UE19_9SPHN|nr:hypothetical protein GCM10011614_07450 [Novosphingobium colocasiae]